MRILILVKATPQPSSTYGDTVCVAGVTLDEAPRWMRLYPVPFRYLDGAKQFKKYDVVEVAVRSAGADQRPESRKINAESIEVVGHLDTWQRRSRWVEPLAVDSMCGMISAVRQYRNSPSLAAIRPVRVTDLLVEPHDGWSAEQRARLERYHRQDSLFDGTPTRAIEPPRFRGRYRYVCGGRDCPGHEQGILDWEFTALQRRFWANSDDSVRSLLRRNFYERMFERDTAPLLFVGNQENPARRQTFSVLGVYYPRAGTTSAGDVLF